MEVVVAAVKKILIIARNAGASELTMFNRIDSEFSEQAMARDVSALASGINEAGFKAVVYAPGATYDKEYYAHYSRFVENAEILYDEDMLEAVLPEVAAAILAGVPAKAGTENAFMDSTFAPRWRDCYIDGARSGEVGLYRTFLAGKRIPIIGVVGDEAVTREAREEIPDAFVVVTKTAKTRFYATETEPAGELRAKMTTAAAEACASLGKVKIPEPKEIREEIEFMREDDLEDFTFINRNGGFERTGARRLAKTVRVGARLSDFTGVRQ